MTDETLHIKYSAHITERQWQGTVTAMATLYKWRWYHTFDSRRSNPGFPDLVLVKGKQVLFVELKTDKGRLSKHQEAWLADLREAGQYARVWRPKDWPGVQRLLSGNEDVAGD